LAGAVEAGLVVGGEERVEVEEGKAVVGWAVMAVERVVMVVMVGLETCRIRGPQQA
jgi:hypothetical protein